MTHSYQQRRLALGALAQLALATGIGIACSTNAANEDRSGRPATGLVTAAAGGTITTPDGIVLEVPPGAVARDVTVTLTPVTGADVSDPSILAGARFEPEGLDLLKPATLRIPIAKVGAEPPLELLFNGSDARQAVATGAVGDMSSGTHAVFAVWHFSGLICAKNCHGGTREFLTSRFLPKGVDLTSCITAIYGKDILPATCEDINGHGTAAIQSIVDTFFDETPDCCDDGKDVPPEQLEDLARQALAGRNVVVTFNRGAFGPRENDGGGKGFYGFVAHSATVEIVDGVPMLRNTVIVPESHEAEILKKLGGTNLTYWPLSDLNRFRKLYSGEALEVAACKDLPEAERPGCLTKPNGPFPPLVDRPHPWTAVRIYVERATPPTCEPPAAKDAGPAPDPNGCAPGFCGSFSVCPPGKFYCFDTSTCFDTAEQVLAVCAKANCRTCAEPAAPWCGSQECQACAASGGGLWYCGATKQCTNRYPDDSFVCSDPICTCRN